MLTVFNVGQGDAALINPLCGCIFDKPNDPLLIDTGRRNSRIAHRLPTTKVNVLLTHSHDDHIGGLPILVDQDKIKGLYIPYYLPEITSIYQYVQDYTSLQYGQPNWLKIGSRNLRLVSEDDELCDHITVLNPPKSPLSFSPEIFPTDESNNIQRALAILSEYGMDLPREDIINYVTPISENSEIDPEYRQNARIFVHRFFISLSQRALHNPSGSLGYYVDVHLELTSNQASIVFKYTHPNNGRWLFTGDADETVFERLISSGKDIRADYLKVPHHGSRENISRYTLKAIDPKVAIISHGNRRFGRSEDTHPHHEVIDMLDQRGIRSYYTNDVIKDGIPIKTKATGTQEGGLIEFV
jgi:beta-lactamase superfamily II metal-dependent hydrolase